MSEEEIKNCFVIGFNHDIGYEYSLSGKDIGYEGRLEDIKSRYGKDSIVYKRCLNLVERIKNK